MPVSSFTDWLDVHVGPTAQPILSAKIQVALAIGTSDQLNAFKTKRNITVSPCTASTHDHPMTKKAKPTALANMLSTFIDNLALSLPKRSDADQRQQYTTDSRYQLRRTSDLLDVLHSALKNPAPVGLITSSTASPFKLSGKVNLPINHPITPIEDTFRVIVQIDCARSLSCNENTCDDLHNTTSMNDKPCTYVSFEAIECDNDDGLYSNFVTNTVPHNCNPCWNEKFNVRLPVDYYQQVSN